MKNIVSLDIGGTKIYAARYDHEYNLQAEIQVPTEADKGRAVVFKNIIQAIKAVIDPSVAAIGIAWAGFVDAKTGHIIEAPNIPNWIDVPLAADVQHQFEVPAFLDNDARLFTLAEQRHGAAKGLPNVIGLIVGTGVGSGIVINHQLYRGSNGYAGEVGHLLANLTDQTSSTQVEDLFAGPHLEKFFQKQLNIPTFREVEDQCKSHDPEVCALFQKVIERLSAFLYNLTLIYNPDMIVIGGGVGKNVIPIFKDHLFANFNRLLKKHPLKADIVFSDLKNSGALGAAIFAQESLIKIGKK